MRMPMLAAAALACVLTPALAQMRILTIQDQTQSIPAAPQVSEPTPPTPAPQDAQAKPQEAVPPRATARYAFNRVDDGFLRLDTQTGQVAFCSARGAGWACHAVPEDRAAFEQEIARLQDEIAGLKKELAALREPPPPRPPADLAPAPPASGKSNELTLKLPTQEELDRASAAIQEAWRRLIDMLVNFKNDMMRRG